MNWDHRFYWILTVTDWGEIEPFGLIDSPSNTREYTPASGQIQDVNFPPEKLGIPIAISLIDRENIVPRQNVRIPPGCEPIYFRLRLMGQDIAGRPVQGREMAHVIGFAQGKKRIMLAVSDCTGETYGVQIDEGRNPRPIGRDPDPRGSGE